MKSHAFLLSLLVGVSFLFSCTGKVVNYGSGIIGNGDIQTIEREISKDIRIIDSYGSFDLRVNDGVADGKISITGDSNLLEYIETRSQANHLLITLQKGRSIGSSKPIQLNMNARTLNTVNLHGSGDVFLENISSEEGISLAVNGSGDISGKVSARDLSVRVAGSGDIKLSGDAENLQVIISGSGDVNTMKMNAVRANTEVRGSGDARIYVTEALNANISGSGTIRYKGPAEKIHSNVRGSGSVKKID